VIEAVGDGVKELAIGDRVAYGTSPLGSTSGSYAEARNIPAKNLVKVPDGVDDRVAAAVMLKGMTAHYLLEIGRLPAFMGGAPKPTMLVHAASGGVGTILCQWAKHRGAFVIGTAGSEEKAALARANGCDEVILYRSEKVSERIVEITKGAKVDVVFDSVGRDTFKESIASLRPRGILVAFGQSSGSVEPFELRLLQANGSLFLTRPVLGEYVSRPGELAMRAGELFEAIRTNVIKVRIAQTYALRDAAKAHADLAARKTSGSTLLIP
jgi:NADPH2:quinone reductase